MTDNRTTELLPAERGTLTADDIRDLIERHSDESGGNGRDFHNGAYVAIADELNGTLGDECEMLPQLTDTVCVVRRKGFEMEFGYWRCSACGCENFEGAKYCMNCGAKVVKR